MPDEVLPQITLTGSGASLDPAGVLAHALRAYQLGVRAEAERAVLGGPLEMTADMLSSILMEIASGHLTPFRFTAGVAFRTTIKQAHRRQLQSVTEAEAAQAADEAALNLGSYLAATSSNAVMEGYHLNVNAKIPPKESARRAVRAFGLTPPQMRTAFRIKDDGVVSTKPGAWKSLLERFIERAFGQRIETLVANSLHQVATDAVQRGWEAQIADGTLPETAQKMWVTASDERTCPVCAPMDGVVIGVLEKFRLPDGNRVKTPPVHPNCRCTAELVDDDAEPIAKGFDPQEQRDERGRWATKTKPFKEPKTQVATQEEQRLAVHNLLAGIDLRTDSLSTQSLTSQQLSQSTSLRTQGLGVKSLGVTGLGTQKAPARVLPQRKLRTHAVIGGQERRLSRISLAHRASLATHPDYLDQVAAEPVVLPPGELLSKLPRTHVAYAAGADLDLDDLGGAEINNLTFVNQGDPMATRAALNASMRRLDTHLQNYGTYATLADAEGSADDGIKDVATQLRIQTMSAPSGRSPSDPMIRVSPDDAKEAWRILLAPPRDGMAPTFPVYLDEGRDGEPLTETTADAATIVALTGIGLDSDLAPQVITAPHGVWDDGEIGTTERMHSGPSADVRISGPYRWTRGRGGIQIVPDSGAYQRANPEY